MAKCMLQVLHIICIICNTLCIEFAISKPFLYADFVSKTTSATESEQDLNKNEVLSHLKMNGGVKTDFKRPSTEFMLKLFRTLQHGKKLAETMGHTNGLKDIKTDKSDTVRSFSGIGFTESQRESFTFQLPLLPLKERTRKVEVRFQQTRKQKLQQKLNVIIKQKDRLLHNVRYRGHSYIEDEYIVFDLTSTLQSLINDYHGNLTIEFKGKSSNMTQKTKQRREATFPYPILVLYSESGDLLKSVYGSFTSNDVRHDVSMSSNPRSKRAANKRRKKHKKSRWMSNRKGGVGKKCQIHDFYIDFNLIGWGPWIIHPKKFNSHACFGTCPSPITYQYSPTNHAILQTLMRIKRPLSAPEACCVPIKLQPLSMLYFEYDEIVLRYHEDMVVTECGCR